MKFKVSLNYIIERDIEAKTKEEAIEKFGIELEEEFIDRNVTLENEVFETIKVK